MTSKVFAVALLAACAPSVDGPAEQQRTTDRVDATLVQMQLATLPGTISANVVVYRPIVDPLAPAASARTPSVSAVILVDDATDRPAVTRDATALLRAIAPSPSLVVAPVVHRPLLAQVGPFTVAASSRNALRATLAVALAAIALLAGWVALTARRRT